MTGTQTSRGSASWSALTSTHISFIIIAFQYTRQLLRKSNKKVAQGKHHHGIIGMECQEMCVCQCLPLLSLPPLPPLPSSVCASLCACVVGTYCLRVRNGDRKQRYTHTHTHTHIYIVIQRSLDIFRMSSISKNKSSARFNDDPV